jgi:DNA polymerase elongation subunit (family B)
VKKKDVKLVETTRILLFDLENSPSLGYFYDRYADNPIVATVEEWFLLSFAFKWLGEKETHVYGLPDFPRYKEDKKDDEQLVRKLHEVLTSADVLIAHNLDNFDLKKANARFLVHGLEPIPYGKNIDTLKIARQKFKFNSNKLDDLGKILGVGRKLAHTGIHLWLACIKGEKKAWKEMKAYNAQDVVLLEKIYLRLRPWSTNHPNVNWKTRRSDACPKCGSTRLMKRGYAYAATGYYERYQCLNCLGYCSGTLERLAGRRPLK